MGVLALLPLAAAATPAEREFWRPEPGIGGHPVEVLVRATLVASGTNLLVYREQGYVPASETEAAIDELIAAFDRAIHPRLTAVFGAPPDVDSNGAIIVLITRLAGEPARFWRFNQLSGELAQRNGFHSNEAEILYTDLGFTGNRRAGNLDALARAYAELLLFARDPVETAWSRAIAAYAPFLCGLSGPRLLWGEDAVPSPGEGSAVSPRDHGLWLLALEYLRERIGDDGLAALATSPSQGLAALDEVVRQAGLTGGAAGLFADAAMAAWLGDRHLASGRFSFRDVHPPRARDAVQVDSSRASAGSVVVPVGLPTYLRLGRSSDKAQPLSLQGQPEVRWVARAVHLRPRGPDVELPLLFAPDGVAHLDMSSVRAGEEVVVAALSLPATAPTFDRRHAQLFWGLGWVPRLPGLSAAEELRHLLAVRFPDGGTSATARLSAVMARLTGGDPPALDESVTTRYAWAPQAGRVPDLLLAEAAERALPVRRQSFVRVTPTRIAQEWSNVLIELPGTDARRWPVVVAAHWDAGRAHIDDSYAHALGAHDNASGVAVALEAAGAIARARHRAPVLVAFLAGGLHGAAGANALLDELQGRVTAWIELDAVGVAEPFPNHATITVDGEPRMPQINAALVRALREQGLALRPAGDEVSSHAGASTARHRGIPAVVLRTTVTSPSTPESDLPAEVDLALTSPELMVLLARAVASTAVALAGAAPP